MNTCLEIGAPESRRKYIAVIYNGHRYFNPQHAKFLTEAYSAAALLDSAGIPVRTAIPNNSGQLITQIDLQNSNNPHLFGLYNYLPGRTLPWEGWTRRHLRALGRVMQRIHKTWSQCSSDFQYIPRWTDYLKKDSSMLIDYLTENSATIKRKLNISIDTRKISNLAIKIDTKSNYQLTHNDLVRGNILFGKRKYKYVYPITGIIDFEKTMYAPVIVDIARTYAFLLVDCKYKTDLEIKKYYLDEGYFAFKKETPPMFESLENFVIYFWLRDLWKFLSRNPYEDLKKNYHYTQTVERLNKAGFLK
jgi:Ser/Thr protein kinase RdoA (MazF antagonist)